MNRSNCSPHCIAPQFTEEEKRKKATITLGTHSETNGLIAQRLDSSRPRNFTSEVFPIWSSTTLIEEYETAWNAMEKWLELNVLAYHNGNWSARISKQLWKWGWGFMVYGVLRTSYLPSGACENDVMIRRAGRLLFLAKFMRYEKRWKEKSVLSTKYDFQNGLTSMMTIPAKVLLNLSVDQKRLKEPLVFTLSRLLLTRWPAGFI